MRILSIIMIALSLSVAPAKTLKVFALNADTKKSLNHPKANIIVADVSTKQLLKIAPVDSNSIATIDLPDSIPSVLISIQADNYIPVTKYIHLPDQAQILTRIIHSKPWSMDSKATLVEKISKYSSNTDGIEESLKDDRVEAFATNNPALISTFDNFVPRYIVYAKNESALSSGLASGVKGGQIHKLLVNNVNKADEGLEIEQAVALTSQCGWRLDPVDEVVGVRGVYMDVPVCPDPNSPNSNSTVKSEKVPLFSIVKAYGCLSAPKTETVTVKSGWKQQGGIDLGIKEAINIHFSTDIDQVLEEETEFTYSTCSPTQLVKIEPFTSYCCRVYNSCVEDPIYSWVKIAQYNEVYSQLTLTIGYQNSNPCTYPSKDSAGKPVTLPCAPQNKCYEKRNDGSSVEIPCVPKCPNFYDYESLKGLGYQMFHPLNSPLDLPCPRPKPSPSPTPSS